MNALRLHPQHQVGCGHGRGHIKQFAANTMQDRLGPVRRGAAGFRREQLEDVLDMDDADRIIEPVPINGQARMFAFDTDAHHISQGAR